MRQASFAPAGASPFAVTHPRLTPWAAFLRRFAACVSSLLRGSLGCDRRHNRCCRFVGAGCAGLGSDWRLGGMAEAMRSHESRAGLICSDEPTLLSPASATTSYFREQASLLPDWFRSFRKLTRRNFWLFETSRRQTSGSRGWFGVRGGAICAHFTFCLLSAASVGYVRTCTQKTPIGQGSFSSASGLELPKQNRPDLRRHFCFFVW